LAIDRVFWKRFVTVCAFAAIGSAVVVVIASCFDLPKIAVVAQPIWFALIYCSTAIFTAIMLLRQQQDWSPQAGTISVIAIATVMGLVTSGVAVNSMIAADPHSGQLVAQLRTRLPQNVQLVSFGKVGTMFSYHWREPIALAAAGLPKSTEDLPGDCEYFCFNSTADRLPRLPFPWRVEAVVRCDRATDDPGGTVVFVGRRVETVALLPDETKSR
jgi:hypothetical protein